MAQNEGLTSVKIDTNYTLENSTLAERDSFYYGLPKIESSNSKVHFRFSIGSQIVDIKSEDYETFQGVLVNRIFEYKQSGNQTSTLRKVIYQKVELDPVHCSDLIKQVLKTEQDSFPTDSMIPSWYTLYLHCEVVDFQFKTEGKYRRQSYHCPWWQSDTTVFASEVDSTINLIKGKLDLENRYDDFKKKLPLGKVYSQDGFTKLYYATEREYCAWKKHKPRREYLKSIKDTIDAYLESELLKREIVLNDVYCVENYQLEFGKDGRLKKVDVLEYDEPTLSMGFYFYFEDLREIRKCKRLIKNIFKDIDLSSFDLKYGLSRILTFDLNKEVQLRDNTIY